MKFKTFIFYGVVWPLFFLLNACTGLNPANLSIPDNIQFFELSENRVLIFKSESDWSNELLKGKYISVKESEFGIYFKGAKNCYRFTDPDGTHSYMDGGVFVPRDQNLEIKPFVVVGTLNNGDQPLESTLTPVSTASSSTQAVGEALGYGVVSAIIAAEKGRYNYVRDVSESSFEDIRGLIRDYTP